MPFDYARVRTHPPPPSLSLEQVRGKYRKSGRVLSRHRVWLSFLPLCFFLCHPRETPLAA